MAEPGDQPPKSDADLDKSELKAVGSKQRLAKQAEVEVVEESEGSRTSASQMADNGEDHSPNSDESDRTVVDTGQQIYCFSFYGFIHLFYLFVYQQTANRSCCG